MEMPNAPFSIYTVWITSHAIYLRMHCNKATATIKRNLIWTVCWFCVCVFSFARFVIHYDIFSCEFFLFHSLRAASASNANICSFRLSTRFFMILLILRKHTQFMMVWFRFYGLFAFALFPSTAQPFRTIGFCWFSIFVWKLFSQIIEARNWKMNKEIIGKQTRLKWCKWNGKQRNFELVWYESVE